MKKNYNFVKSPLILILCFLFIGCEVFDAFPGGEPIPEEAQSELLTQRASLTVNDRPFPDDVGARYVDRLPISISGGSLSLFIEPEVDLSFSNPGTYYYSFSRQDDENNYTILINRRFSNPDGSPRRFFLELYKVPLRAGMEPLSETTDFVLEETVLFIPVDATHLELRFKENQDTTNNDPIFIERWSLLNFYAYNRYIEPLINY